MITSDREYPSPPSSPEPEREKEEWRSLAATRSGEQRYGQLILGRHLPQQFEVNVTSLQDLLTQLVIHQEVAIQRHDVSELRGGLMIYGSSDGTAIAQASLADITEPEDTTQISSQPNRHIIGIDFEAIRVQASNLPPNERADYQAKLIEMNILVGLRKIARHEMLQVNSYELLQAIFFCVLVSHLVVAIAVVGAPGLPNYQVEVIDTVVNLIIDTATYLVLIFLNTWYDDRHPDFSDLLPWNGSEEKLPFTQQLTNHILPLLLVRNGARAISLIESHRQPPHLVRPTKNLQT